MSEKCGAKCEVYSRCCGYYRPVTNWNKGKQEEFKDREKFKVPGKGVLALLLMAVLCLASGCSTLENKAFALGSGVDAFKLETSGGVSTGTVLPNLILGGAVNTLATAPAVADGAKTQVVFVRSRRNSFFGELFGIDAVTESVSYIGTPGETAEETAERLKAFASLDNKGE